MFHSVEPLSALLKMGSERITETDPAALLKEALNHYHDDLGGKLVTTVPIENGEPMFIFTHYQTGDDGPEPVKGTFRVLNED